MLLDVPAGRLICAALAGCCVVEAFYALVTRGRWLSDGGPLHFETRPSLLFRTSLRTWTCSVAFLLTAVAAVFSPTLPLLVGVTLLLFVFHKRSWPLTNAGDTVLRLMLVAQSTLALAAAAPWSSQIRLPWFDDPAAWVLRLQLAVMYFYAGVRKLHATTWRRGTACGAVFRNPGQTLFPTASLPMRILGSRPACWGVLAFEVLLAPMLLVPPLSIAAAAIAIGFHIALALTLRLHFFSGILLCAVAVLLFHDATHLMGWKVHDVSLSTAACLLLISVFVVIWDIGTTRRSWIRARLAPGVAALSLNHHWNMFCGDPPPSHTHDVFVLCAFAGGCSSLFDWGPRHGVSRRIGAAHLRGLSARHRKFLDTVILTSELRRRFLRFLSQLAANREQRDVIVSALLMLRVDADGTETVRLLDVLPRRAPRSQVERRCVRVFERYLRLSTGAHADLGPTRTRDESRQDALEAHRACVQLENSTNA